MNLRRRRRYCGQSLVEFALIAPLLFAMLFIVIELGIIFSVYIGLTNSAREGARAGAIRQYVTSPGVTPTKDDIDDDREAYINNFLADTYNPIINQSIVDVDINYETTTLLPTGMTNDYREGETVVVELSYEHPLFFGMLGPRELTIQAHSAMRIETGGTE